MKYRKLIILTIMLALLTGIVGCSSSDSSGSSDKYPSSYAESAAQTLDQVKMPSAPGTLTASDGTVGMIDYSNYTQGYIQAKLLYADPKGVKLQISKDDKKYNYDLTSTDFDTFPLQMGNGYYTFKILENIEGDNYALLYSLDLDVEMSDENLVYLYPNQTISYNLNSEVIDLSFKTVKGDKDDLTRVYDMFNYVVKNIKYDHKKANEVNGKYVLPNLNETIESKEGICWDYAALLAAMCRIQNIPAKVIVGYTDIEYHSWVMIYLKGKGWINPKIEFAGESWSRLDPTFAASDNVEYEGRYDEVYHY